MKKASSKLLLLDVNVLLALAWPNHQFHAAARKRLYGSRDRWATCALTQLGFIRISSNPAAVGTSKSPAEAARLLSVMTSDRLHTYLEALPAPVSGAFLGSFEAILGSQQVTDAYLLALSRAHRATLVTFDARLAALDLAGRFPGQVDPLLGPIPGTQAFEAGATTTGDVEILSSHDTS